MNSMQDSDVVVIGGVDAHTDTHEAAALDQRGALLGTETFATTFAGYAALLDWLRSFGRIDVIAIESTGAYAAGLVRYLREHDIRVLEVNQPHAHTRRRRGKSDPIDAEMAARLALTGKATTIPKQTDGIVESIRLLRVTRAGAVKARSAAMLQLSELIITAPQQLREQLTVRKTIRGQAALCRRLRPALSDLQSPSQAAKLALRSLAKRIDTLDAEIAELDTQLQQSSRGPRRAPRSCWASRPGTPGNCSSPPARTSIVSAATARSPHSAARVRSRRPPGAPSVTASTTAATATPTAACT